METNTAVNASRFWAPPDNPPVLADGFLASASPILFEFEFGSVNEHLVTTAQLSDTPCLFLLGPPGIGKTTELRRLFEAADSPKLWRSLAEIGSSTDLEALLKGAPEFGAWASGSASLALFLDAFDEGRASVEPLGLILRRLLTERGDAGRLQLRIACRDADHPVQLERAMRGFFGDEVVRLLVLAPLRQDDARAVAEATLEGETGSFLESVLDAGAGPLASVPLTLRQLVRVYEEKGRLPSDRAALFSDAVRLLAEDPSEDRVEARRAGILQVGTRVRLAARVAALLRLSDRTHLHVGMERGALTGALLPADVTGEEDLGLDVPVEAALRELALHTGLFVGIGPGRFRFIHAAYEEYLAAEFLASSGTPPESSLQLLSHPEGGLYPQLRETAAWLAALDMAFFDLLAEREPQTALKYVAGVSDTVRQERLVERYLELQDQRELSWADWLPQTDALIHPDVEDQLRRWVRGADRSVHSRSAAIGLLRMMGLSTLASDLLEVALNTGAPHSLRHDAALGVKELGSPEQKEALRPLLQPPAGQDQKRYLAYDARAALFPRQLSLDELVRLVKQDEEEVGYGLVEPTLRWFLREAFDPATVPRDALLEWLGWVASLDEPKGLLRLAAASIVEAAAEHLDDEAVADALAHVLLPEPEARRWHPPVEHPASPDGPAGTRHALVAAAARVLGARSLDAEALDDYAGALLMVHYLLQAEDIPWMIERVREEPSAPVREVWAVFLNRFTFFGREEKELVLSACLGTPTVWELLPVYLGTFAASDVEGSEADAAREGQRQRDELAARFEVKMQPIRPHPPVVPSVEAAAERVIAGSPVGWELLVEGLNRDPEDARNYGSGIGDYNLHKGRAWAALSDAQRERVVEAASIFLRASIQEIMPVGDLEVEVNPVLPICALRLLQAQASDKLDALPDEAWAQWCRPMVAGDVSSATEEVDWRGDLLRRAYEMVPDVVCDELRVHLARTDSSLTIIHVLDRFWDERLRQLVADATRELPRDASRRHELLEFLLDRSAPEAVAIVLDDTRTLVEAPEEQLSGGQFPWWLVAKAFRVAPSKAWEELGPLVMSDAALGERWLRALSGGVRGQFPSGTPPGIIEALYMRLHQLVPPDRDPPFPNGRFDWNTDHGLRDLRGTLASALADGGTAEHVAALERVAAEVEGEVDLQGMLRSAREQMRRLSPPFLDPETVRRAAVDPGALPIRSDRELKVAVVRALWSLQSELDEGLQAAAVDLWNVNPRGVGGGVYPRDENDISDYIARYLWRALSSRGVVVAREAEVYRGSETDILLTKPLGIGRGEAVVVAEVKGAWNREVTSGLREQLARRYLRECGRRHGVYIAVAFDQRQWQDGDGRRERSRDPDQLRAALATEADESAKEGFEIEPIVLVVRSPRSDR